MSAHVPIPESDRRGTLMVGVSFVAMLIALIAGLVWSLQADRDALVERIEQERLEQLDNVVLLMAEDVGDVIDDLRLLGRVAETSEAVGVSQAVLAGVPAYRAAAAWGQDGARVLSVSDPRRPAASAELSLAMQTVEDELRGGGKTLEVSSVVELEGAFYRVFGHRPGSGVSVVLAVDTSAWLSGLRLVSSDPSNRVLVLGPGGRVAPASDPSLAANMATASSDPEFARLLDRMRKGERGSVRIGAPAAQRLGLPSAAAVAAFGAIRLDDGEFWSVATLTSVASLESQETALVQRFVAAIVGVLLMFIVFAAYVVILTRRTALLRERLVHAAELAEVSAQLLHAEKLATVGGLSAGIAHEIGTPLGVIRGRAEYVLKKVGEDHPQASSLKTIIEQIDRVSKIIRELLDYSRPRPAAGEPTDLAEVVEKAVALLVIEFERSEIELVVDVNAGTPALQADPDHLQQVLVNLLVNARDACDRGNVVRIVGDEYEGVVRIEVTDDGPGIPQSYVHQIFDPFFTTKKRGHGTGLGLAVVSQIVRSHGGTVEVASEEGIGTTIRILWPSAA